jgi:hypothetical protein
MQTVVRMLRDQKSSGRHTAFNVHLELVFADVKDAIAGLARVMLVCTVKGGAKWSERYPNRQVSTKLERAWQGLSSLDTRLLLSA